MDLKATALLKLIYLEMFGHDMSWASFHVLEVMSCPKYLQKRVGYLAAVQSFRPDTEVLMLATNLLKKVWSMPLNFCRKLTAAGCFFFPGTHNVSASSDFASHHHIILGSLSFIGPLTKVVALERKYTEEDGRSSLQACVGIP